MAQGLLNGETQHSKLTGIIARMPVYDRNGKKVGEIKSVGRGFIKIEHGFLWSDCYALADQVETVCNEGVRLNIEKEALRRLRGYLG